MPTKIPAFRARRSAGRIARAAHEVHLPQAVTRAKAIAALLTSSRISLDDLSEARDLLRQLHFDAGQSHSLLDPSWVFLPRLPAAWERAISEFGREEAHQRSRALVGELAYLEGLLDKAAQVREPTLRAIHFSRAAARVGALISCAFAVVAGSSAVVASSHQTPQAPTVISQALPASGPACVPSK